MVRSPGDYIREEIGRRGWSQVQFAEILERPIQVVNEIIKGKRSITTDTAAALGASIGPDAVTWLNRESEYRLSLSKIDTSGIERRVRLYDMAPIRDMEKRGWIKPTANIRELEEELMRFFGVESLETAPQIGVATRRTTWDEQLTPSQRAWCFKVKELAQNLLVAEYKPDRLPECEKAIRKIAAFPQQAYKVSQVLASFGIRFVVVEPLPTCKVDGVALWLDDNSPVIGLSARFDRIDSFWFTLCHELSHIRHRDESPIDSDVTGGMLMPTTVKPEMERRADDEAAGLLIPSQELESFILRVGPLYSKDRINRFANRIKMHPGIVVGQLQHRGEIGFHANKEMLVKIRQSITPATITDGWGHTSDARNQS